MIFKNYNGNVLQCTKSYNYNGCNIEHILATNEYNDIMNILLCIKPFLYRSECQNEIMTLQGYLNDTKISLSTLKYNATEKNRLN